MNPNLCLTLEIEYKMERKHSAKLNSVPQWQWVSALFLIKFKSWFMRQTLLTLYFYCIEDKTFTRSYKTFTKSYKLFKRQHWQVDIHKKTRHSHWDFGWCIQISCDSSNRLWANVFAITTYSNALFYTPIIIIA